MNISIRNTEYPVVDFSGFTLDMWKRAITMAGYCALELNKAQMRLRPTPGADEFAFGLSHVRFGV